MLKTAIVGCGKIADAHAQQLGRIPGCGIVAACDREPLMARQLCDRFPVARAYDDLDRMLSEARPDVVHITTPPQSHFALAERCLQSGCHLYIEKPFALTAGETARLLNLAKSKNLKITAGHDEQFSPVARRLRALIASGYLGGPPVHMESYYGYELSGAYANALLSDCNHWVRKLPGGLLHNIISHGIARLAEFLPPGELQVIACGFTSPFLQNLGEREIVDELRVIIHAAGGMTAYFTFSSQMRPPLHLFRVYGPRNGLLLDQDQELLLRLPGRRRKSYLEKFVSPLQLAGQYFANVRTNAGYFLKNEFHMKAGMYFLIQTFYASIREDRPVPIPVDQILRVAEIMDAIFSQLPLRSTSELKTSLV